jgi:hypothetical protein
VSQVTPDTPAALRFLRHVYPDGPWALTALEKDRKTIETRTFSPGDPDSGVAELENWLKAENGARNLYWSVGEVRAPVKKKADKEDIGRVHFLHVDIDAAEGKPLAQELERIRLLVTDNLPPGVPRPTFIIFSGGGYQAFWRLKQPITTDTNAQVAEVERYNIWLAGKFGGDHCHDVSRIMRLPGSCNLPGAKKALKGRVPALAVMLHNTNVRHDISTFEQAPLEQSAPTAAAPKVDTANIARVSSVDELDAWEVPDRVKVVLVQGHDPDNPKAKDNSRSAWLFDAVCQLVRKTVPDEVIFSLITDRDYKISASVLENKKPAKYALRQIAKAKEFVIEPWLAKMNEQFAVIQNWGGKCRVIKEVEDPALNRSRLTSQGKDDFCQAWCNKFVTLGQDAKGLDIKAAVGAWWFSHERRREYSHLVFAPGVDGTALGGPYNLWQGFAVEPVAGDCRLFLDHLHRNICNGVHEHSEWLLDHLAHMVQHPAQPGYVAVALQGDKGAGKGAFVKYFGALWGRHFLQVSEPSHLTGHFNSHLRDCVVLFADEAFHQGDKKHEATLKRIVTEETLAIEGKGKDIELSPNYLHIFMATNEDWAVPATYRERRFFVLTVADNNLQDTEAGGYFSRLAHERDHGGLEALLHLLQTRDVTDFNPRTCPETKALRHQKKLTQSSWEDIFDEMLHDGATLDPREVKQRAFGTAACVSVDAIVAELDRRGVKVKPGDKPLHTTVGMFLRKMAPDGAASKQVWVATADGEKTRHRFWPLRSLAELRAGRRKVVPVFDREDRVAWAYDLDDPLPETHPGQGELEGESRGES